MAANRNAAYDLSLFEPKRQEQVEKVKKNNIIEIPQKQLEKNSRPKRNPIKVLASFLFIAILGSIVGTMIYGQVQLTELTEEINTASKELAESQSVYTQMKTKMDSQLSVTAVETYAAEELDMRKIEQNQVKYISLSEGDEAVVMQDNVTGDWWTDLCAGIANLLS